MLAVGPGELVGGLLGMALMAALCGGYGYLLVGSLLRPTRGSLFEYAGLCVLLGFAAYSWIGSVLAVASLFHWWLLLALAAIVAVLVRRRARREAPLTLSPTPPLAQVGALALLCGAALLFAHPAETWMLFDDSAVYAISGVHLAEWGTLIPSIETFVCRGHHVFRYWGPYRWWDACETTLAVGFLPTPKVWPAIAAWLFGRGGAVWSAPLSGILAMLACFLFIRRIGGSLAALAATALLTVSFPQVWFSRTLMSETFSQIALFGGLYLLYLERENNAADRPSLYGIGAAFLLGLLAFIRFEALLFLGLLLGAWLVALVAMNPDVNLRWPTPWLRHWLVWVGGASLVALGLSFAVTPHYYVDQLVKVLNRDTLRLFVLAAAALAIGASLLHRFGIQRLWSMVRKRAFARILLLALSLTWALTAGLDLWLRGAVVRGVTSWLPLYLGWPGFLLGAAGILWLAWGRPKPEAYALLALALIAAIGYALRPLVTLVHPWAIRRFVPFIIPTLALGIGAIYERLWEGIHALTERRARQWRWPASGALLFCLGVSVALFGRVSLPFATYRETAGLWEHMEELAALYPQDAIVIYDDGPLGQRLPQVMEQVFGRSAIAYPEPPGPAEIARLEAVIAAAHAQGRRVFLTVVDGDLMWESERYGLESYAAYVVEAPRVVYERIPPPTTASIVTMRFLVDIYEVVPRDELTSLQGRTVVIPMGQGSFPYLRQGFHHAETDAQGRAFRWTSAEARIVAPVPTAVQAPSTVEIALDLAAWRPAQAGDTIVAIEVQGRTMLETQVEHIFEPQRFQIVVADALAQGQTTIEIGLRTTTWQPADFGMGDQRALGAILYGVTLSFADGVSHD